MTGIVGKLVPRMVVGALVLGLLFTATPLRAQDDDGGFAVRLSGIVNALDIFFSMPLQEWNSEIVRLPNVGPNGIFGSVERGLGVRFRAGGFMGILEPDFVTPEGLSCLRIIFQTSRPFTEDRINAIEEDKIKPMMETLSLRYDSEYALESSEQGMTFTMFITRKGEPDCLIYDEVKLIHPGLAALAGQA